MMNKIITLILLSTLTFGLGSCSKSEDNSSSAKSKQCQAITQKGEQCKRNAAEGSIYCWQHKK